MNTAYIEGKRSGGAASIQFLLVYFDATTAIVTLL